MQVQNLEKIKTLVNGSLLLSPAEKNEWASLLDLMDDRQLFELQKILTSVAPKPQAPPVRPAPPPREPLPVPKLSHIMNMPHFGEAAGKPAAPPVIKPPVVTAKPEPKARSGGFMQRIKNILAEKELPAPKSREPFEISAAPQAEKEEPKTVILKTEEEVFIKAPVFAPAPKQAIPQAPVVKPPIARPATPAAPARQANVSPKPVPSPALAPKSQSGISFGKSSEQDKEKILNEIKQGLENKKWEAPMQVSITAQNVNILPGVVDLETMEDLAELSPKIFSIANFESLVKKIRSLIGKNGYHTVVFNIEKSPLYKAYIKTGSEILNSQTNFEALEERNGDTFLTRKNFEECADLLRQIQAG